MANLIHNVPVEETINRCDDLIEFQKITKISSKYGYAVYGKRRQQEKVFRLFASKTGKQLRKMKNGSSEKISYTPEKCKVVNSNIENGKVPDWLDRDWYIQLAEKRVKAFMG